MPTLFDPVEMGALELPNRIVMAPLTRARGTRDAMPTAMMADYYVQRAAAGLIISEAIGISREGLGWPFATGLWNMDQVEGWKPVVDAVHAAGGRIVAQLWHMGRVVHANVSGMDNISASALTAPGMAHTYAGKQPYAQPRAATRDDIARILADYAAATRHALAAGFDGVQIHAANGYLIDQFLRDSSNHRDDDYGGSIANRIRFLGEVIDAVASEAGMARTGLRLSPNGDAQGVDDSDHLALFAAVAEMLETKRLPWLEMREPGPQSSFRATDAAPASPVMRPRYSGVMVLNSDYDRASASAAIGSGAADAISFGRPFIANPDLVERLRIDAPLNTPDVATYYSQGREGYTDYPGLAEQAAA